MAILRRKRQKGSSTFEADLKMAEIVYIVLRSFFKYLVCNVKDSIFQKSDYLRFFKFCLKFFIDRFSLHKSEFRVVHKILSAKLAHLRNPEVEKELDRKFLS